MVAIYQPAELLLYITILLQCHEHLSTSKINDSLSFHITMQVGDKKLKDELVWPNVSHKMTIRETSFFFFNSTAETCYTKNFVCRKYCQGSLNCKQML